MKMILRLMVMLLAAVTAFSREEERPNILWITCEDISPYLGCYGSKKAQTPNLDGLAAQGIRFTHAYAQAPVCAVARSTLLTGMYSSTIGTHHMRSWVRLPDSIPAYPRLFHEAGYYCTNNHKKDYNSRLAQDERLWDESSKKAHWKNRKPGQPFFAVFNFEQTHEGQLSEKVIPGYVKRKQIPAKPRIDPSDIELPPYHPDHPEIREDWARLHDLITHMDALAGKRLKELEEEGEAENTIVFFYSDHGGTLSRSKRYLYDVGTRVPLIVYFPEKWRHLAPSAPGTVSDELVSFIDFPKTVLSLAGIDVPELMQGRCFMGAEAEPAPQSVHFTRDRMGEVYDFSRSVTDGRWFYTLNFYPHRPRGRDTCYGFDVQKNWRVWRELFEAGECNEVQSQFFSPKAVEELFDTENDPFQIDNLADHPESRETLVRLRNELLNWMVETRDIGLIPEPLFYDLAGPGKNYLTMYEYAQSEDYPIERILPIAMSARMGDKSSIDDYMTWLKDPHPVVRYWGAYGLFLSEGQSVDVRSALGKMMEEEPLRTNRIVASLALVNCGGDREMATDRIVGAFQRTKRVYEALFALEALRYANVVDLLEPEDWTVLEAKNIPWSMEIDNSQGKYITRGVNMLRESIGRP